MEALNCFSRLVFTAYENKVGTENANILKVFKYICLVLTETIYL